MFLMIAGALTILFAVFMALIQHSGRKLLAYHAISQVGYMVLGIGTGNPIGICGGLFHMMNHAIYKSCLFLGLGNVERRTGTDDLDRLGGLAGKMPLTLFTMFTASLAISGIPPLNGFFSKWLIYQGVIQTFSVRNPFVPALCLIAALFGSALTLASFAKLIHAIFLARSDDTGPRQGGVTAVAGGEPPLLMVPQLILAIACIALGIFAGPIIIKPVLAKISGFHPMGVWQPELAFTLVIAGVILGLLMYGVSRVKVRTVKGFIGGEEITPDMKVSGTGFYLTIEQIPLFGKIYGQARKGFFDLYEILKTWVFFFAKAFKFVHCGSLPFYLLWLIGGLAVILILT
jgi:formate hydrogenlyase subunit 3/multisubunit Na+/H+ antiporter MnhD subunit